MPDDPAEREQRRLAARRALALAMGRLVTAEALAGLVSGRPSSEAAARGKVQSQQGTNPKEQL